MIDNKILDIAEQALHDLDVGSRGEQANANAVMKDLFPLLVEELRRLKKGESTENKATSLIKVPLYVVIADNHQETTGSQWLVGVFLTKEEAADAAKEEEEKSAPQYNISAECHEWTILMDPRDMGVAMSTTPSP